MNDIVERIDKLILGWEREYGITNKTMVDAMQTIIELKDQNRILIETIRVAADQIEMTKAQLLIRGDLIEKLKYGPGGITEMKQTIADKETEIGLMEKDLDLVYRHDSNLLDHLKGWK
jgi:hypothetical protein